jgi:hypothetical protein
MMQGHMSEGRWPRTDDLQGLILQKLVPVLHTTHVTNTALARQRPNTDGLPGVSLIDTLKPATGTA